MPTYLSTGTTSTTTNVWQCWVRSQWDTTTTAITTADLVWSNWSDVSDNLPLTYLNTRINRDAERELRREFAAEEAQRVEDERIANARAEALLLDACTEEQGEQYRRHKHVIAVGNRSGLRYRIRLGRIGNVDVIDRAGRVSHRLCAHPRDDMPDADCVLIQKLMIESDEDAFVLVANRHPSFDRNTSVLPAQQ